MLSAIHGIEIYLIITHFIHCHVLLPLLLCEHKDQGLVKRKYINSFPFTSWISNNSWPLEAAIGDVRDNKFYRLPPRKETTEYAIVYSLSQLATTRSKNMWTAVRSVYRHYYCQAHWVIKEVVFFLRRNSETQTREWLQLRKWMKLAWSYWQSYTRCLANSLQRHWPGGNLGTCSSRQDRINRSQRN